MFSDLEQSSGATAAKKKKNWKYKTAPGFFFSLQ
jgi:hypothetical protein